MSTDPAQSSAESTTPPKKRRNPAERLIVWGLILVLVAIVGAEAMARYGYENSLKTIEAKLDDLEADDPQITVDEVDNYLFGLYSSDDNPDERVLTYKWRGVFKEYGTITMPYSRDNVIRAFATADAAIDRDNIEPTEEEMMEPSEGDAVADAGGGEGGRGGGRRFDPMQRDADGDGKLSREEASERMQENFDAIDTNGDGFAEEAEIQTYFANRRGRRGEGGEGGEGGQRPQRPQRPEIGETAEQPAAESAEQTTEPETETEPDGSTF